MPLLWDGDVVVWDSLAIIDYLADKVGRDRFWPADDAARAYARSMAAEMHAGYAALRREHGMNTRRRYPAAPLSDAVAADVERILTLWAQARARWGGSGQYLFGDFGVVDIMFAPVATRFTTWSIPLPPFAAAYCDAVLAHPWMQDWLAAAQDEPWVIEKFEQPPT